MTNILIRGLARAGKVSLVIAAMSMCASAIHAQAALEVIGSTPKAGASDVSRSEPIVFTFSTEINPRTVATNWVDLLSGPNAHRRVDFSVAGSQLSMTPRMAMVPGSSYTLEMRPGIRGVGGERLARTVRVTFTTRQASWQGSQDLAMPGAPGSPNVTSRGDTFVAVWRHTSEWLALSRYSPQSGWSEAAIYATLAAVVDPQVFLDAAGAAHVIWGRGDGTLALSRHTAQSGWSGIEQVPTDGLGTASLWKGGMDDAGNLIVIWKSEEPSGIQSLWANRYVPGNGWGTPVQLESNTGGRVEDIGLAVDAAGDAMAHWMLFDQAPRHISAKRYTRNAGWGPTETASGDNVRARSTARTAMLNGETIVVYSRGANTMTNVRGVLGWLTPEAIGNTLAGVSLQHQVAFESAGNAFAAWIQHGHGPTDEVWGNARSANGTWSTPRRIAVAAGAFTDLGLAMGADRSPIITVKDFTNSTSRILSGRYRSGTGWFIEALDASQGLQVGTPRIQTDVSGSAVAVWITGGNNGGFVRGNVLE